MTHAQQRSLLKKHVAAFLKHQQEATNALREIAAIGLLENEGNPLVSPIAGEDMLCYYIAGEGPMPFMSGDFNATIDDAKLALENIGYVV